MKNETPISELSNQSVSREGSTPTDVAHGGIQTLSTRRNVMAAVTAPNAYQMACKSRGLIVDSELPYNLAIETVALAIKTPKPRTNHTDLMMKRNIAGSRIISKETTQEDIRVGVRTVSDQSVTINDLQSRVLPPDSRSDNPTTALAPKKK